MWRSSFYSWNMPNRHLLMFISMCLSLPLAICSSSMLWLCHMLSSCLGRLAFILFFISSHVCISIRSTNRLFYILMLLQSAMFYISIINCELFNNSQFYIIVSNIYVYNLYSRNSALSYEMYIKFLIFLTIATTYTAQLTFTTLCTPEMYFDWFLVPRDCRLIYSTWL